VSSLRKVHKMNTQWGGVPI